MDFQNISAALGGKLGVELDGTDGACGLERLDADGALLFVDDIAAVAIWKDRAKKPIGKAKTDENFTNASFRTGLSRKDETQRGAVERERLDRRTRVDDLPVALLDFVRIGGQKGGDLLANVRGELLGHGHYVGKRKSLLFRSAFFQRNGAQKFKTVDARVIKAR